MCLGFDVTIDEAKSYYVVFEERKSERRFGLDYANTTDAAELAGMELNNLSWEHFPQVNPGEYIDHRIPTAANTTIQNSWNSATYIAKGFTQQQVRVIIKLGDLLSE